MTNKQLLVVEDNGGQIGSSIQEMLRGVNHLVDVKTRKNEEAFHYLSCKNNIVDFIIADGETLNRNGISLMEDLKKEGYNIDVHILTEKKIVMNPSFAGAVKDFSFYKGWSPYDNPPILIENLGNILSEPKYNRHSIAILGPGNIGEALAVRFMDGFRDSNGKPHLLDRLFLNHRREERAESLKSNLNSDNINLDIFANEDLETTVKNSSIYVVTLGLDESTITCREDLVGKYYLEFFDIFDKMRNAKAKGTMIIVTNRPTENTTIMNILSQHYLNGKLKIEGSSIIDYKRAIKLLNDYFKETLTEDDLAKIEKIDINIFGDHGSKDMIFSDIQASGEFHLGRMPGYDETTLLEKLRDDTIEYGLKETQKNKWKALTGSCTSGIIEHIQSILYGDETTAIIPLKLHELRSQYFQENIILPEIAMGCPVIRRNGVAYPDSDAFNNLNDEQFSVLVNFAYKESFRINCHIKSYEREIPDNMFKEFCGVIQNNIK